MKFTDERTKAAKERIWLRAICVGQMVSFRQARHLIERGLARMDGIMLTPTEHGRRALEGDAAPAS